MSIRNVMVPNEPKTIPAKDMNVGQAGYIRNEVLYEGYLIFRAANEAYVSLDPKRISWSFSKPNFSVELLPKGTVIELVVE